MPSFIFQLANLLFKGITSTYFFYWSNPLQGTGLYSRLLNVALNIIEYISLYFSLFTCSTFNQDIFDK